MTIKNRVQALGAHTSIAGGLHLAIENSRIFNGTALQIFSKNNNQWQGKVITHEMIDLWNEALSKSPIREIAIHDSYLINLCSPDDSTLEKSKEAFLDEHLRAEMLGIRLLNFHPGAAVTRSLAESISLVAENINIIHDKTKNQRTISVIELTAGQGTTLGSKFEEVAEIINLIEDKNRVGVCIDTCHIFAAGYDIRTKLSYEKTIEEFDKIIGLNNLKLIHLNDSKQGLGSRKDRHEHIGKGNIGIDGFKFIMQDNRLIDVPMVIETPKEKELLEDIDNIKLLRSLALHLD
ncbi:MAG: deoxyribonuclease IV [Chlorobiota bacterium]|nr:deoxyribonuclease IV [Chlorobiota bacterium]QQS66080.1 MAG: deoxyribonuclease IV [Chlorobiota bacterium]